MVLANPVYLGTSPPKLPHIHRIFTVLANLMYKAYVTCHVESENPGTKALCGLIVTRVSECEVTSRCECALCARMWKNKNVLYTAEAQQVRAC